ncbi:hypothetical protein [Providencia rettgeri]|uniref:hypothetical protein n=1 Tax=Providencia rettgeri TaxID=587 RepID=UPI0014192547|nr:hypothetical protein [Providencia rettgeri]NIH07078.1 hypothetical protein [Providencia rettgeri]
MKYLNKIQIENIKCNLQEKINTIKNSTPIYNKLWPQLELPTKLIYRLVHANKDLYVLYPIDSLGKSSPKIPTNKYSFVILLEDPLSVYCFSHTEIFERQDLRIQAQGHVNYGHSSLSFIKNKQFSPSLPAKIMAKPVLLAGHLNFCEHEHLSLGGGEMISWTVDSGHYRPSALDAHNNRVGYVKKVLPMDKFKNIYPD